MKPSLISDEAIELVAHRFAILGEPMRLRLLRALFDGEKNVSALVELTAGSQANISRHLQYLATAGLAGRRKEGLEVFYSIADSSIFKLCELVCGSLEKQLIKQAGAFGTGPNR
jgi:ArsR family transcriptional regulator